jgi:hypothetical protein
VLVDKGKGGVCVSGVLDRLELPMERETPESSPPDPRLFPPSGPVRRFIPLVALWILVKASDSGMGSSTPLEASRFPLTAVTLRCATA